MSRAENHRSEETDPGQDVSRQPYVDRIVIRDRKSDYLSGIPRLSSDSHVTGRRARTSGPKVLIIGFALIVLVGTLLLKLPWASASGQSITWGEALFTSTSATTVTGLVVLNTATDFSFFGQVIILLLLQVGGVGFIAFSVLLYRVIGRRINLQTRFLVQQSLGSGEISGVLDLALYVLGVTLFLEAIGAVLLWLRWQGAMPQDQAIWYSNLPRDKQLLQCRL